MLTFILTAFYLAIGLFLAAVVAIKPNLFWYVLAGSAVFSAGLMTGGYTIIDEYFLGCVIIGGFLALLFKKVEKNDARSSLLNFLHDGAFALFISYMVLQSARGALLLSSPEKIRWIVFFAMLGVVGFVASKKIFRAPDPRMLALVISSSFAAYSAYYLGYGFFTELLRGLSRYAIQPGEWSTTAYATFPAVVGIPAAIILMRDRSRKFQAVGWLTAILAVWAAAYYQIRTALLAILAFFAVSLPKLGIKKIAVFLLFVFFMGGLVYVTTYKANFVVKGGVFFESLYDTARGTILWEGAERDIDRRVHLLAGFATVSPDWTTMLFGYGWRVHGYVMGPYLYQLFEEKGFSNLAIRVTDNESTEGFSALLIDTGWVGVFLLVLNFSLAGLVVLTDEKSKNRLLSLASLALAFLWLPVINMLDITLLYLMIMPDGIVILLNRASDKTHDA